MRRDVLSLTGSMVLGGGSLTGFLTREPTDGDITISIDEECTSASLEMQPPPSETWSGVIEYLEDETEIVQIPACGETVTGGSNASVQVSLSSPGAYIHRVYIVEGTDLEGPVVAEENCGRTAEVPVSERTGGCEGEDPVDEEPVPADDELPGTDSFSDEARSIAREVQEEIEDPLKE